MNEAIREIGEESGKEINNTQELAYNKKKWKHWVKPTPRI